MIQRITKTLAVPVSVLALGALGLGSATTACEPPQLVHDPSAGALPKWEGHAREVFDDNIDPAAVGLTMEGPSPRNDAHLRERAQMADVVARVRVQTVTVDSVGDQKTYHLGLQVGIPTLTEAKVPDRNFELSIKPASGAFGIARSFDARLRGQTFVGFIKRYSDEGDVALHWHLAPDTAEVAAAVKEAVVLREISGS
jgi:hypothetical protein